MTRQPFRTKCSNLGKDTVFLAAFQTDGSLEQAVSCLRLVLSLLDDEAASQQAAGIRVDVANAFHQAGNESQYSVSLNGPATYIQGVYRRFLRAPQHSGAGVVRYACPMTPIGTIRSHRLEFPDGNISMPVVTVASAPELAALLSLRLGAVWPPRHDGRTCDAAASGAYATLA